MTTPAFSFAGITGTTPATGGFNFNSAAQAPPAGTTPSTALATGSAIFGSTPGGGGFAAPAGGFQFGGAAAPTTASTAASTSASVAASTTSTAPAAGPAFAFGSLGGGSGAPGLAGFSLTGAAPTASTAAATSSSSSASSGSGIFGSMSSSATTTTPAPAAGGAPAPGGFGAGFAFNTAAASSSSAAGSSSAVAASQPGAPAAAPAPAAGAPAAIPAPDVALASSRLRHINVEEMVALWSRELEEHVHSFVQQAALVQKWDQVMLENFKKIVQLQNQVRNVQVAQVKLNALLETIKAHQSDFNTLLDQLESSVDSLPKRSQLSQEELKREEAFALAEEIDSALLNMGDQLAATVQTLNLTTEKQMDPTNPLSAVLKILNVHQNSLGWLDQSANELQNALTAAQRNVSQMQLQDQAQMRGNRQDYSMTYQSPY